MVTALALVVAVFLVLFVGRGDSGRADRPGEGAPDAAGTATSPQGHPDGYSSDLWGRQVVTNGVSGQPLGALSPSGDRCTIDPTATIQTSHGAQTMWTTSHGPVAVRGGIPVGYAQTATGAALAGWNYRILLFAGGDVTAAVAPHIDFGSTAKGQALATRARTPGEFDRDDAMMATLVPEAVKVVTCKDDFMVVDMAHKFFGDRNGKFDPPRWDVMRFAMTWRDGDWVYSIDSLSSSGEVIYSIDGWTRWAL